MCCARAVSSAAEGRCGAELQQALMAEQGGNYQRLGVVIAYAQCLRGVEGEGGGNGLLQLRRHVGGEGGVAACGDALENLM
jgi:hypothetical protein